MAGVATKISQATTRPLPSVGPRQRLTDHPLEGLRQLRTNLLLLVRREHVDDAVDGLRSILGVQRGVDEVAGLGSRQRNADRLKVAHFTDQDDVRVLTQYVLQRVL